MTNYTTKIINILFEISETKNNYIGRIIILQVKRTKQRGCPSKTWKKVTRGLVFSFEVI